MAAAPARASRDREARKFGLTYPQARKLPLTATGGAALTGLVLGLLALGPALGPGYVLAYDMVFVPSPRYNATMFGLTGTLPRAVPSDAVVTTLAQALPADVVQKCILLAIFVLASAGATRLLAGEHWLARIAAGVIYAWNPFVAERLLIGQWALLLGYAGLPWVLAVLARPVGGVARRSGRLLVALLPAAVGGFAAMSVSALVAVPAAASERDSRLPKRLATVAVTLAVLGLLSLPWLIPGLSRQIHSSTAGVAAFAARADTPFGTVGSVLMLGGEWNAQTVPAGYGGALSVFWLCLVLVALAGFVLLGSRRWPGLAVAAVAGLILALLGAFGPGQHLLRSMIGLWGGFAVLRDGQQFAAPAGFGLAVGWLLRFRRSAVESGSVVRSGSAVQSGASVQSGAPASVEDAPVEDGAHGEVAGRRRARVPGKAPVPGNAPLLREAAPILAAALVVAPVLFLPGLAWGAADRLRPVEYPASWLAARRVINSAPQPGSAVLLPWASYRRFGWNNGEAMLDPWPRLLNRTVIWNDGVQVGSVQLPPEDPAALELNGLIRSSRPLTARLEQAGVRFVVVDAGPGVSGAGSGGPADAGLGGGSGAGLDDTAGGAAPASGQHVSAGRLAGCTVVFAAPGLVVYRVP
jgi:hypothetical protein